jgi:hypothetical protein
MAEKITEDDLDLLDELGVETAPTPSGGRTPREQRIIAGFEEIERFVEEHGRLPQHGEDRDIFERLYAVRLEAIRNSPECRAVLKDLDPRGLLGAGPAAAAPEEEMSDEELLAELGVEEPENDVTQLVHVRSRDEIKAAEEIARRTPCKDFAQYKPLFEQVQRELEAGQRRTIRYSNYDMQAGDFFILEGQKALLVEIGEEFLSDYGRPNRRLKVIYDNGTQSDPLLRSFQRALYEDPAGRRITELGFFPLFSDEEEADDLATGYIYVLRSKSEHPFVAANRLVMHKIGVTGGDVKARVAGAKKDPTYLLADVEIVTTYKLANINRKKLEALLHKFFAGARLDMELKDRFGGQVEPREWFLVPFPAIEEAVERITHGTIEGVYYDPATARIVRT